MSIKHRDDRKPLTIEQASPILALVFDDHVALLKDGEGTSNIDSAFLHAYLPLRCMACGAVNIAESEHAGYDAEPGRGMGTESLEYLSFWWACGSCGSDMEATATLSEYPYGVLRAFDFRGESGCEPVHLSGFDGFIDTLQKKNPFGESLRRSLQELQEVMEYYDGRGVDLEPEEAVNRFLDNAVIVLGSYHPGELAILEQIKAALIDRGYDAYLLKDRKDRTGESIPQKAWRWIPLSRFAVLYDHFPSGANHEYDFIKHIEHPLCIIRNAGDDGSTAMMATAARNHTFIEEFEFIDDWQAVVDEASAWAESHIAAIAESG